MRELCDDTRDKKSCKRHKHAEPEQQFQSKAAPRCVEPEQQFQSKAAPRCVEPEQQFQSKAALKCPLIQAHADAQIPQLGPIEPHGRTQPPSNAIAQGEPIPFTDTDYMSCVSSIKLENNIFQIAECGTYSISYCVQVENSEAAMKTAGQAELAANAAANARNALEAAQLALVAQEEAKDATIAVEGFAREAELKAAYAAVAAALVAGSTTLAPEYGITGSITGVDTPDNREIALAAAAEADLAANVLDAAITYANQKVENAAAASADALTAAIQTGDEALSDVAGAANTAAIAANSDELAGIAKAEPAVSYTHDAATYTRNAVAAVNTDGPNTDQSKDAANAAILASNNAGASYEESRNAIFTATYDVIPDAISAAVALVTAAETVVTSTTAAAKTAKDAAEQEASAVVLRYKVPNCEHISPCCDCPPIEQYTNTGWTTVECSRGFLVSTESTGSISGQYQLEIKHRCILVGLFNDTQSNDGELSLNPDKSPNTYINIFRVATCDDCCYANSCDK